MKLPVLQWSFGKSARKVVSAFRRKMFNFCKVTTNGEVYSDLWSNEIRALDMLLSKRKAEKCWTGTYKCIHKLPSLMLRFTDLSYNIFKNVHIWLLLDVKVFGKSWNCGWNSAGIYPFGWSLMSHMFPGIWRWWGGRASVMHSYRAGHRWFRMTQQEET